MDEREVIEATSLELAMNFDQMPSHNWRLRLAAYFAEALAHAVSQGREQAALVVDLCNREGPYNAIGAAKRIRALNASASEASRETRREASLTPRTEDNTKSSRASDGGER